MGGYVDSGDNGTTPSSIVCWSYSLHTRLFLSTGLCVQVLHSIPVHLELGTHVLTLRMVQPLLAHSNCGCPSLVTRRATPELQTIVVRTKRLVTRITAFQSHTVLSTIVPIAQRTHCTQPLVAVCVTSRSTWCPVFCVLAAEFEGFMRSTIRGCALDCARLYTVCESRTLLTSCANSAHCHRFHTARTQRAFAVMFGTNDGLQLTRFTSAMAFVTCRIKFVLWTARFAHKRKTAPVL